MAHVNEIRAELTQKLAAVDRLANHSNLTHAERNKLATLEDEADALLEYLHAAEAASPRSVAHKPEPGRGTSSQEQRGQQNAVKRSTEPLGTIHSTTGGGA